MGVDYFWCDGWNSSSVNIISINLFKVAIKIEIFVWGKNLKEAVTSKTN